MSGAARILTHARARGVMIGITGLAVYPILMSQGATQAIAYYYGYHPALGPPLVAHLYAPWEWFLWQ